MPVLEKPVVRRRRRDRWRTGPLRLKAVLRPWAGRLLPRELRAQNVAWLVARWPEGVRAPEFEELVARIDAASFHCGDRIEFFHRGYAAVAAIEREIDAARE